VPQAPFQVKNELTITINPPAVLSLSQTPYLFDNKYRVSTTKLFWLEVALFLLINKYKTLFLIIY
jgi:hypothetical protein